jgi:hypothetical protein
MDCGWKANAMFAKLRASDEHHLLRYFRAVICLRVFTLLLLLLLLLTPHPPYLFLAPTIPLHVHVCTHTACSPHISHTIAFRASERSFQQSIWGAYPVPFTGNCRPSALRVVYFTLGNSKGTIQKASPSLQIKYSKTMKGEDCERDTCLIVKTYTAIYMACMYFTFLHIT